MDSGAGQKILVAVGCRGLLTYDVLGLNDKHNREPATAKAPI